MIKMKKMIKILIGMIMLLCLSFTAFAADDFYETNQTISLDATYTQGSVLTHANANYTVELPDGTIDADQVGMTELSDGVFSAEYVTSTQTGKTLITVIYYDDLGIELGRDSRYIQVGYAGGFTLGQAPQSTTQLVSMWIMLAGLIILAFVGMMFKINLLTIASSMLLLGMCFVTMPFSTLVGGMNIVVAVILLLAGMFAKE